jgi:hypothetical protein
MNLSPYRNGDFLCSHGHEVGAFEAKFSVGGKMPGRAFCPLHRGNPLRTKASAQSRAAQKKRRQNK